jgi:hypothetical protein
MISDTSLFDVGTFIHGGTFVAHWLAMRADTAYTVARPFRTFTGMTGRICELSIDWFGAVLGDYAVAEVELVDVADGGQPEGAQVFIVRPSAECIAGAVLDRRHHYFGRVEGVVAGFPTRGGGAPATGDFLVFSLADAGWDRAFSRLPVADALFLRMYREAVDEPVRPAGGFPAEDDLPPMDPDWYLRAPVDNTTRPRGSLYISEIEEWQLDSGLVRAFVGTTTPDDDGHEDGLVDALLAPPLRAGQMGPWMRVDTFAGVTSLALTRPGRRGRRARAPATTPRPVFALDLRAGRPPADA